MNKHLRTFEKAEMLFSNGQYRESNLLYKKLAKSEPKNVAVLNKMGLCHLKLQEFAKAEALFFHGLLVNPELSELNFNLAQAFQVQKKYQEAITYFSKCIEKNAYVDISHFKMGQIYRDTNNVSHSINSYNNALKVNPNYPEALNELGLIFKSAGLLDDAGKLFKKAVRLNPTYVGALINLGTLYLEKAMFNPEIAEKCLRKSFELDPKNYKISNNLGLLYMQSRNYEDAIEHFNNSVQLNSKEPSIQSNRLFAIASSGLYSVAEYAELATQANKHFKTMGDRYTLPSITQRNGGAKLHLGFVSGDIKNHPVTYFLLPLLSEIDKQKIEITLFDNTDRTVTTEGAEELKPHLSNWYDISNLETDQATAFIREKRVDILIDLSGHTARNRMSVFANRASPIQLTWLGFLATTGIEQIDYILLDKHVAPKNSQAHFSEKIVHMPNSFLCFGPPNYNLNVQKTPALKNKFVTFGCFNNAAKVGHDIIKVWAEILSRKKQSKIVLGGGGYGDKVAVDIKAEFSTFGIEPSRIIISKWIELREERLKLYNEIDVALDTFPYNGVTTTCEALWMGVPVVSKKGNCLMASVGASILHNSFQSEFCVDTERDYVEQALAVCDNLHQLNSSRIVRREKILQSSIFNSKKFALDFQHLLESLASLK